MEVPIRILREPQCDAPSPEVLLDRQSVSHRSNIDSTDVLSLGVELRVLQHLSLPVSPRRFGQGWL